MRGAKKISTSAVGNILLGDELRWWKFHLEECTVAHHRLNPCWYCLNPHAEEDKWWGGSLCLLIFLACVK